MQRLSREACPSIDKDDDKGNGDGGQQLYTFSTRRS